jgi:hypothetical protein
MYRRSFIKNSAPDLYLLRIVYLDIGGIYRIGKGTATPVVHLI